ncbi:MAG TPA: hypothetical protein VGA85_04580 [Dehalococcoidales bacterium]
MLLGGTVSCGGGQEEGFAIYLADTRELMLSERHIEAYHSAENTLELNAAGIKRWNSYLVYTDIPKLNDTLFSREFIIKIEGKEICRGRFWSYASSASYSGVVIFDALFPLDAEHNLLWIRSEWASGALDPTISSELVSFFEKHNLLK